MGRSPQEVPGPAPGPARDLVDTFARLRAARPLSGGQIALRTGLSASYISEVTRGVKAPSPEVAAQIARVLGAGDHDILRARQLAEQLAEVKAEAKRDRQQKARASRRPAAARRAVPRRTRATLAAAVLVGLLAAVGIALVPPGKAGGAWLTGSVTCQSGRPVVGIWIAASAGQLDSGYAHLGPALDSRLDYASGPTVTYSYRLAETGPYAIHVGCGGTAHDWASRNFSDLISRRTVALRCDDPVAAAATRAIPVGFCIVLP